MTLLSTIFREIFGLFVEDEFLALATLAIVGLAALLIKGLGADVLIGAGVLFGGCVLVLLIGVWRTAR
jgi:hypothetical protein